MPEIWGIIFGPNAASIKRLIELSKQAKLPGKLAIVEIMQNLLIRLSSEFIFATKLMYFRS